jgi:hypothetical protein
MKLIFTLLLILLSAEALAESSDLKLKNALIGSWVKSVDDPSYNEYGFITEYKADGTTIHRDYPTKTCKVLETITTGKWKVENSYLTATVETSEGVYPLPIGAVVTDKIIRISKVIKVLETDTGIQLLRSKSEKCL